MESSEDPYSWHYEPGELTVEAGTTVRWENQGRYVHTVTVDDRSFASPNLDPGATWEWTFDEPGDSPYHCSPHPWMQAAITVVDAG